MFGKKSEALELQISKLELEIQKIASKQQLLQDEWANAKHQLDSMIRRAFRANQLEAENGAKKGDAGAPEAPAARPATRAELLRMYGRG